MSWRMNLTREKPKAWKDEWRRLTASELFETLYHELKSGKLDVQDTKDIVNIIVGKTFR